MPVSERRAPPVAPGRRAAPMMCPKCGKDTLEPFGSVEGVHIDFCKGCKGIWFDEGELAFYTEMPVDVPRLAEALAAGRRTGLECPRCSAQVLVEVSYLPGEKLLLDVCPGCRGVFVDKGELPEVEKISTRCRGAESILVVARQLEAKGYTILGARKA
jgi:Zn-finger nucleic acid-binding protein